MYPAQEQSQDSGQETDLGNSQVKKRNARGKGKKTLLREQEEEARRALALDNLEEGPPPPRQSIRDRRAATNNPLPQARPAGLERLDRTASYFLPKMRAERSLPSSARLPASQAFLAVVQHLIHNLDRDIDSPATVTAVKGMLGFANLYNKKDTHPTKDAIKRYEKVITSNNPAEAVLINMSNVRIEDPPQQAPPVAETLSKSVKNRITKFVQSYQASNAIRLLESISKEEAPIDNFLEKPEVLEVLQNLHPRAMPDRDGLPLPDNQPAIVITKDELMTYLKKLPPNKAAALSGWTFELIKTLINDSDAVADAIVRLFNLIVQGKGGPASIWLASRLIPIKKGAGGIRPIAVADCWMRFLSGFLAQKLAPDAAKDFAPYQFGVGVSGGVEIVIHAVKTAVKYTASEASRDNPHVVLAIDCKNAFNCMGRRAIYNKMSRLFPLLNKFIYWAYGTATPIYASDGTFLFYSETGVKQGDPLGPLLFAAGLQDILSSLHVQFPGVTVLAYLDDITIFGPPDKVALAYLFLKIDLALLGLGINRDKCQLFYDSNKTPDLPEAFAGITPSTTFIKILGTPMGSDGEVIEDTALTMDNYVKIIPLILQLPVSIAYILLKSCINPRPIHLLRTVEPELTKDPIKAFDDLIDRSIHILLKKIEPYADVDILTLDQVRNYEALPTQASLVRSLPANDGGVGIRKGSEINGAAWTASYLTSLRWLANKIPSLIDLLPLDLLSNNSPTSTHLNNITPEYIQEPITTIPELKALLVGGTEIPSQRKITKAIVDPSTTQELVTHLQEKDHLSTLAWFKSCCHPQTGAWLSTAQFPEANLRMFDSDYVENLRLRLLMPIFTIMPGFHLRCPCKPNKILDPIKDMYHCLSCGFKGPFQITRIGRHNQARNALQKLLQVGHPTQIVLLEQKPTEPLEPNATARRSDVVILGGGANPSTHVDVAIANPAAESYVRNQHTDTVDLAAAKYREDMKLHKYVTAYGEAFRPHIKPFVIEATGAYGPIASAILKKLGQPTGNNQQPSPELLKARNHFLRKVSVMIASTNAHLISFARTQMRPDGPGGVEVLPQENRAPAHDRALDDDEISQVVDDFMSDLELDQDNLHAGAMEEVRTHHGDEDSD